MCGHDTPLSEAIKIVGMARLSRELDITHQAIRKWLRAGRMPRTEWTGETAYGLRIQELTSGAVTRERLLAKWQQRPESRPSSQDQRAAA